LTPPAAAPGASAGADEMPAKGDGEDADAGAPKPSKSAKGEAAEGAMASCAAGAATAEGAERIKPESVRGSWPEPTITVRESTAARPLVIVRAVASFCE